MAQDLQEFVMQREGDSTGSLGLPSFIGARRLGKLQVTLKMGFIKL